MKRRAFTLSELWVTLSVIGIVSVLVAPMVTNFMPDKNKARLLKYNVMLNDTINEILNNDALYHPRVTSIIEEGVVREVFMNDSGDVCAGLSCIQGDFVNLIQNRLIDRLGDGSQWTITKNEGETYTVTIIMDENKASKEFTAADTKNINTFI